MNLKTLPWLLEAFSFPLICLFLERERVFELTFHAAFASLGGYDPMLGLPHPGRRAQGGFSWVTYV